MASVWPRSGGCATTASTAASYSCPHRSTPTERPPTGAKRSARLRRSIASSHSSLPSHVIPHPSVAASGCAHTFSSVSPLLTMHRLCRCSVRADLLESLGVCAYKLGSGEVLRARLALCPPSNSRPEAHSAYPVAFGLGSPHRPARSHQSVRCFVLWCRADRAEAAVPAMHGIAIVRRSDALSRAEQSVHMACGGIRRGCGR